MRRIAPRAIAVLDRLNKKTPPIRVAFFCDCSQVLLPVRTPVYRKERNVCKGNLSRVSLAC